MSFVLIVFFLITSLLFILDCYVIAFCFIFLLYFINLLHYCLVWIVMLLLFVSFFC